MARQDAFRSIRNNQDPANPVDLIPKAEPKKRSDRSWERNNPTHSYLIPHHLHDQENDLRTAIKALAGKHMTTTSCIAGAMMSYSLAHVRSGKLSLESRPDPNRRTMTLTWEEIKEGESWPQELPKAQVRKSQKKRFMGFRWGKDMDTQVRVLSQSLNTPAGEVVVYLLNYALVNFKEGHWRFKEETITIAQRVSPQELKIPEGAHQS